MNESEQKRAGGIRQYTLGINLYRRGQYEKAIKELEPLTACKDVLGRVARYYYAMSHRKLGIDSLESGRFNNAETHIRAAVEAVGNKADLPSYMAAVYARTRRMDRCADEIEKIIESGGDGASARRKLAQAQWNAGRRTEAYMTLTSAISRFAETGELHMQMGLFYAAEERFDEARREMETAAQVDCTNADCHYYLGLIAQAQQDLRTAVRSYQRSFDLRPDDLRVCYHLALAAKAASQRGEHFMLRVPEQTRAANGSHMYQLAGYVTSDPDFIEAFLILPPSEADSELFGLLAGVLEVAISEHPDYADLHFHCSRTFNRLGQADAALRHARRAVQINPNYVQALIYLGKLYSKAGKTDEAIDCLERAILNGGDWPDVHCLAGELLGQCNRVVDARKHLGRALQLNSGYTRAADALESLAA